MAQDPMGTLLCVRANSANPDPAMDLEAMDLDAYRSTREWDLVKLKPDAKPDTFVLRQLPGAFVLSVLDGILGVHAAYASAFLAGCHEVRLGDGTSIKPEKFETGTRGVKLAHDAWLTTIRDRFGLSTVIEMGQLIYERARLPEGAKGPFSSPGG